ncbi:type I-C CRISPR-associated protein Cas8c/Csd1 [Nonomuraea ferruginea]
MLIQRLAEHAETAVGDKTPRYFRNRAVRWAITLTRTGKLSLISRADADHKQGSPLPTPYLTRTSGVAAMLLVDTLEYGLAVAKDDTDKAQAGADRRNDAYLDLLEAWAEASADPIAELVWETFKAERHLDLLQILPEDAKSSDLIGILVDGEWAHLRPSAIGFWAQVARERKSSGRAGSLPGLRAGGAAAEDHSGDGQEHPHPRWPGSVRETQTRPGRRTDLGEYCRARPDEHPSARQHPPL